MENTAPLLVLVIPPFPRAHGPPTKLFFYWTHGIFLTKSHLLVKEILSFGIEKNAEKHDNRPLLLTFLYNNDMFWLLLMTVLP
ncbi:MAG TPA: hypothetical protein DCP92_17855 [Nitrospiraceae bacterium]|jgi:hypothetical protein|nr:hypothetical protein [Nitrospiraceae bacterium]